MKGRTTCPKCKHGFILDIAEGHEEMDVVCPKCNNKFTIKPAVSDSKNKIDYSWEEHGEPRKTILSSVRPKTNKPRIAAIILITVFSIGIATATVAESFIESTTGILTDMGVKGKVELTITDASNHSLENVTVTIQDISDQTNSKGHYSLENVTLGIQKLELTKPEYKTQSHEILVLPFFTSDHELKMEEGSGEKQIPFNHISCSLILVIFSVFSLLSAMSCWKRLHFDIAIVGSIMGILIVGFFFVGSVLSVIAFILIMVSREEFENGKKGKTF